MQLVHQSQNRCLVRIIDTLGFLLLVTRITLLLLRQRLALAAVEQLHARNTDTASHDEQTQNHQNRHLACRDTGLLRQLLLQVFQLGAQGFAVGNDGVLRFTRRNQPLQVAQNRCCLRAGLLILFQHGQQLVAHLRVTRGRQAQVCAPFEQAIGQLFERVQVTPQQEHGFRADTINRLKLIG